MDDAISLALLIPHAQAAFALLGADAVDVDAAAILRWVQAYGLTEFTRREAQKAQEGDSGASNDYRRPSTDWNTVTLCVSQSATTRAHDRPRSIP
jgi:hypothetical protein